MTTSKPPFATLTTLKTLLALKIQRACTRYPFNGASVFCVVCVAPLSGRLP